jgi:hypothetical protein
VFVPTGPIGPTHVVRSTPRISITKLGEYLVASPVRRRQIILDQKYPPEVKVIRYKDAQRAIVDHLVNGHEDPGILSRHRQRLADWTPTADDSDYEVQRKRNCLEAIEAFIAMLHTLPEGLVLAAAGQDRRRLHKAGVSISIQPDAIIHGIGRNHTSLVGAIKLHFSKTFALDDRAGEYAGTLLHEFGERYLSDRGQPTFRHFYVIDVFARRIYTAPRAFIRRRGEVEAACEEIASRWASL